MQNIYKAVEAHESLAEATREAAAQPLSIEAYVGVLAARTTLFDTMDELSRAKRKEAWGEIRANYEFHELNGGK